MSKLHIDISRKRVPAPANTGARAGGWADLLALLGAGAPLTGPELAQQLGISRAGVWKRVAALRASGLDVHSDAAGYRLAYPLQALDAEGLRAALPAAVRRQLGVLQNHWQLDSTSSELQRQAAGLPDHSFVFAEWQRAGRGRRGRQWLSPPATNLQFSCLKRFAGGYAALAGLSLVVGIAMAQALADVGVPGITLKWPNDLQYGDAKLGGILIELGGEFMGPCHAIIGAGINFRLPADFDVAVGRACTDLARLCNGAPPARTALAAAAINRLVVALERFEQTGFAAFLEAWRQHDALAGRRVRIDGAQGEFDGVALGVDARGALQVRGDTGLRSIDSGEVSVRPA